MPLRIRPFQPALRRPPRGGRGLKSFKVLQELTDAAVALLAEGVD